MNKKKLFSYVVAVALSLSCSCVAMASFERGDDGQEVLDIQKRLAELHYSVGTLDGDFGKGTEVAVKQFQNDHGLDADGIVGKETYRALMNREMPVNRNDGAIRKILRTAYSVIGTPYVFGGTTPYGFDCSGFIRYCFNAAGIYLPRMADEQFYYGKRININNLRTGDLIFFETYEPGASHVGIYLGKGNFIHASSSKGISIANMYDSYWGPRYYGACRINK